MIFNIYTDPVGKPRMTQRDKWAKRPAVLNFFKFRDEIRKEIGDYQFSNHLSMKFWVKMPNSWSAKKKKEKHLQPHDQKPDIDNLIKAVLDSIKKEDKEIWKLSNIEKVWTMYEPSVLIIDESSQRTDDDFVHEYLLERFKESPDIDLAEGLKTFYPGV